MTRRLLRTAGCLLLIHTVSALAADARCASTETCLAVLEAAQRDLRTLSADFTQVKRVSLLDEPLVSRGHFVFRRPDHMLLRIDEPQALSIVIKGNDVIIPGASERDRQAMRMAPVADMFAKMEGLLSGATAGLRADFDVAAVQTESAIDVQLVPRAEKVREQFRKITLRFDATENVVREILLEDGFGDTLELTLRNVQRNVEVPDSTFDLGPARE